MWLSWRIIVKFAQKLQERSHEIAINGERRNFRNFVFVKRDQFGSKFRFDAKFAMNNGEKSTFQSINSECRKIRSTESAQTQFGFNHQRCCGCSYTYYVKREQSCRQKKNVLETFFVCFVSGQCTWFPFSTKFPEILAFMFGRLKVQFIPPFTSSSSSCRSILFS